MRSQLTMLNSMASEDFPMALARHREWGLKWLDLRDAIYGQKIATLDLPTATKASKEIEKNGLSVFCLSSSVFFEKIEEGLSVFKEKHLGKLDDIMEIAKILKPTYVRLIAAQLPSREPGQDSVKLVRAKYPWVIDVYREAVDRLTDAGLRPTIENEAFACFLSEPEEILDFFDWLDRKKSVGLTWDVQNQWATGSYPDLAAYQKLKHLIQYYHVKGGQADESGRKLKWNVALEDASWPVAEITRQVVADGVSPVICLNPAQHGEQRPGYDYNDLVKRDIDFLRRSIAGIE
jgi:sugar phosphate isomerase/epimerase